MMLTSPSIATPIAHGATLVQSQCARSRWASTPAGMHELNCYGPPKVFRTPLAENSDQPSAVPCCRNLGRPRGSTLPACNEQTRKTSTETYCANDSVQTENELRGNKMLWAFARTHCLRKKQSALFISIRSCSRKEAWPSPHLPKDASTCSRFIFKRANAFILYSLIIGWPTMNL